jgi:GTP-binding protein
VGKSTLFNRLAGRRLAIVEDLPGTTRDRLYASAEWTNAPFLLVDTGGIDVGATPERGRSIDPDAALATTSRDFLREIRAQAEVAIEEADVVVFLTDATDGVTQADRDVAEVLRRSGQPVLLAVNKADNESRRQAALEFYELSLGDVYPISALHGTGTGDLLDEIVARLPKVGEEPEDDSLKIAIVGRPNVGKSSLLNALLRQERAIVSPIAGTTRDAIDTHLVVDGEKMTLIDTAGIRRRGRVVPGTEKYSVMRALSAVQRSDLALIVIDATEGVTAQDTHVAGFIADEARKSAIIVVNKWDAMTEKTSESVTAYTAILRERLKFLDYAPVLFVSALTKQRVSKILPMAMEVAAQRKFRVPTAELNRVLREAMSVQPAPNRRGRQLKFLYATQAETEPPTFVIFVNDRELVHFSYARFLENRIRESYPFTGTPIELSFRNRRDEEPGPGAQGHEKRRSKGRSSAARRSTPKEAQD